MDQVLAGKVALVTGAGRGIGRQTALALTDAGVRVAAVSRTAADLESLAAERPGLIFPVPADVSSAPQVDHAFARAKRELGGVSVLVAAAGCAWSGDTLEMGAAEWDRQIAVNLTGLYLCDVAAIWQMLETGGGDIVNVLSIAATMAPAQWAAYTASKAGGLGLTRALHAEFCSKGIRLTAILPGATDTGIWDGQGLQVDRRRMMQPKDVAEAIVWAISRPATASVDELTLMPREGLL